MGVVTRGSGLGTDIDCCCGVLLAIAGELPPVGREPKLIFGRAEGVVGPPLGIWPEDPEALIVLEGFRLWLDGAVCPFTFALLTIAGEAMLEATARPFTRLDGPLPAPAAFEAPCAAGPEMEFLVAWA